MDKVYKVEKKEIAKMVIDLLKMPGIRLIHEIDFNQVFKFWPVPIKDFGDAVIASIGRNQKGTMIVTFDKKFSETLKSIGLRVSPL
jgi:predicted nucleic-acid-binding protein